MNTPVFSPHGVISTTGKLPCIVCCTTPQADWRWLPQALNDKPRQWHFCVATPLNFLERWLQHPNLAAIRTSWRAIRLVQRNRADLLVTNHPTLTFWCALFGLLQQVSVEHVALGFYRPRIPHGLHYVLAQWVYSSVSRFIVHSRAERQFYSESLGIPCGRFEMQHWSHPTPDVSLTPPLVTGEYICVISDRGQDHRTLMAAIARLPEIPLVLVTPRGRAIGVPLPPNVILQSGITATARLNLLKHARFLVLPLRQPHQPCDAAMLVTAMRLGKTFVTANLPNVSDYAFHNSNAILYDAGNPESLANAIRELWQNVIQCEILGENGREFVSSFCAKKTTHHCFSQLLTRHGL